MRVLYVAAPCEDYLADSVFHGLRQLLDNDVVEHPRMDAMYGPLDDAARSRLYGRGFTLYGTLPEERVDRHDIDAQVAQGTFDAVIFSNIHRTFGRFIELLPMLKDVAVAVLDGADGPSLYPYAGSYWRSPHRWFLPRAHVRFHYFKREWTPETMRDRYFRILPRGWESVVPTPRMLHPISFSIPEAKIVSNVNAAAKTKLFPRHVVDAEVAATVDGATEKYAFSDESEYYRDIQRSRFGITTKRSGWDCLRHYELAANGAVPCFRSLDQKPHTCAPHGLTADNCVAYGSAADLLARIEKMPDTEYNRLRDGALRWARANTTRARAQQVLTTIGVLDCP